MVDGFISESILVKYEYKILKQVNILMGAGIPSTDGILLKLCIDFRHFRK